MAIHTQINAVQQADYEMKKRQLEQRLIQIRGMENPYYYGTDMATNAPPEPPALFTNRQRLLLLLTC